MENQKLPNATAVLILGIASILTCCCYGILGIILGVVGLLISKKDLLLYTENPTYYANYSNLNIGRILCFIGIALGIIFFLFVIWLGLTFGWDSYGNEELMRQRMEDYFGR